nr:hypothetical protein [Tanacetum cinerariifolium]
MATTIEQQVALDEALVPSAQRLRIGRSNFRLPSDIHSNESTLQVVYDVMPTVHQHSIRFKMDTRKHIVDLEAFREMLHISPRISGQSFVELPFEDEILEFLRRNVDYAFLIWEDLVYQVEHKNQKKSNEMYYPRFTKVIIHHFMTKKPSIPRQNRVNWHYVRDDVLFSTIKVAYKEYYACATGEAAPKPKASARKKKGGSASSTTSPTPIATPTPTTTVVAAPRLSAAAKGKQLVRARSPTEPSDVERTEAKQLKIVLKRSRHEMHISQQGGSSTDEGTGSKPGVPDVPSDDLEEELSWNSSDDEDVDTQTKGRDESEGEKTDESDDDDDDQEEAEKVNDDDDNEEEVPKINEHETTESDEGDNEATESDRESMELIFTTGSTTVTPIPSPQSTMTPSIISTFTTASQLPTTPTQIPSLDLQSLPTFASVFCFEDRVKLLEVNFSNLSENDEFLKTIDDNMKKIIKEQVKTQVKAQVTRILPRIKESVNAQLEAEVLTRSSHSSRTSYDVATNLSEMELKKILIDKMEGNNTPSEPATESADRSITGTQSQQLSAKLEYQLKEVYKASTDQLDWVNPEGRHYPHNLLQPLPLIPDNHHLNISSTMISSIFGEEPIKYDKHALWGVSHWGWKRQQFYGFTVNRESALDVYSKWRIIAITELKIVEWHNYKHLDWISRRVEDLQLGVESYQKRLNLTKPDTYQSDLK